MKRPTGDIKRWHRIHARKLIRRERHRRGRKTASRSPQRQRVHVDGRRGSFLRLPCPEHLSFEDDYEGVLKLIGNIRNHSTRNRNERIYIDFTPIRTVTPSGALVLAAEIDRWNSLRRSRFRRADTAKWTPNVRRLLGQMGFFDLLKLDREPDPPTEGTLYVKFRSGSKVEGAAVEDLRTLGLEPFVSVPNVKLLFAAVTEAMTNVVHHAYKRGHRGPEKWWLSAAHEAGEVVILIYDQGAGIPKTLPLTLAEQFRDWIPDGVFAHDGRMIEVAHQLSRSESRQAHRGRGLQRDVRRYIEAHEGQGTYRVISGRGEYTVAAGEDAEGRVNSLPRPLQGTLIEWRLKLQ